jgi:DNA-binding NtrC family response regulator
MSMIAILDDEEVLRELLSDVLMKAGYEVVADVYKDEFLKLLPIFRPAVIISDMASPRMDGFEFLRAMKSKNIPIIILSGHGGDPAYIRESKKLGAFACFQKPFEIENILAEVKRALENK